MFKENALFTYQLRELRDTISEYLEFNDEMTVKQEIELITYIGELSYKINSSLTRSTLNELKRRNKE